MQLDFNSLASDALFLSSVFGLSMNTFIYIHHSVLIEKNSNRIETKKGTETTTRNKHRIKGDYMYTEQNGTVLAVFTTYFDCSFLPIALKSLWS